MGYVGRGAGAGRRMEEEPRWGRGGGVARAEGKASIKTRDRCEAEIVSSTCAFFIFTKTSRRKCDVGLCFSKNQQYYGCT